MRTKEVFKSGELAHIWAHGRAERGRCASAMRFEGDTFYSYSTAIARRFELKGGRLCFVLNMTGYSNTTSGHLSAVRRAIPHGVSAVWTIGGLCRGADMSGDFKDVGRWLFGDRLKRAARAMSDGDAARIKASKGEKYGEAVRLLEEAGAISKFFKVGKRVPVKLTRAAQAAAGLYAQAVADKVEKLRARRAADDARRAERNARYEAEYAARNAEEVEKAREKLAAWLAGERVSAPYALPGAVMRIEPDDAAMVETSKGARAPLAAVKLALRFVFGKRATGWHRNGEAFAVGDYQIDAVNAAGVVAGCHRFDWSELERFAGVVGVAVKGEG